MAFPLKVRPPGDSSCPYHTDKDVIYVCEDCPQGTLVCSECVTTRHRTHRLENLANTIPWKKEQVLRFIDATETDKLPSIQKDIAILDNKLLENKTTFQNLILNIKSHADRWKEYIDNYVETNVQNFLEIEKENTEILLKQRCDLLNESSDIKATLGNHRDTLHGGNQVQIFDIKTRHYSETAFPQIKKAKFKKREFSVDCLPHVFGSVVIENVILQEKHVTDTRKKLVSSASFLKPEPIPKLIRRNSTGRIRETPTNKKSEQKAASLKVEQNPKFVRRNSITEHLVKSKKKSELKHATKKLSHTCRHSTSESITRDITCSDHTKQPSNGNGTLEGHHQGHVEGQGHLNNCGYTLVAPEQLLRFEVPSGSIDFLYPTTDDLAWVSKYNDISVRLVDLMGDPEEEVDCQSSITAVSVAPDTGHLWLSCLDRGIREIVPHNPKPPPVLNSEIKTKLISPQPKLMLRRKSADLTGREKNFKTLQRQRSVDFTNNPEAASKYLRKSSFDSSLSNRASPQQKLSANEPKNTKRRKAISQSLNEVEAKLAGIGKGSEFNSHSDESLNVYSSNKNLVLPSINIIPPDTKNSVVCIFNNSVDSPPHKEKMETQGYLIYNEQMQTIPPCLNGQKASERNVREVKRRVVLRFCVEDTPWSLCITNSNTVLVGMASTIVVYTYWGQVLHTLTKQSYLPYCTPPITSLQQMVQCRVTQNVAVIGTNQQKAQHVFIMNSALNLISCYSGHKESSDKIAAISTSPFNAVALCYDSVGNLVVADGNNRSIVLISSSGKYIKTLHQDTWATQALGVQADNTLWAAFKQYSNVEVKLIKYTE